MSRKQRRDHDPRIRQKREVLAGGPFPSTPGGNTGVTGSGFAISPTSPAGGGYGLPQTGAKPASGYTPPANPFVIPKPSGLTYYSQTYPNNYFVEWNLTTWRLACDQVIKQGWTVSYAVLTSWAFEASPFIQSLFRALEVALGKIPFFYNDENGKAIEDWTEELCNKSWEMEIRREILFSYFWGFIGLNFDPISEKVYKYPMQDIDPINRMLRQNTYSFYDGVDFQSHDNLLFVQPSTSNESFLGWMQPITRSFIQMNLNKRNWLGAGMRLAFPLLTIGYPQNDQQIQDDGTTINQYKLDAEEIAANIDPTKGIVFPYTLDDKGNIVKSIEVEQATQGAGNRAHAIFSDFNEAEKNEIREMILGGTLTASVGNSGSRALGDVQERKFESVIEHMVEFVLSILNGDYKCKIAKFYKNFPVKGKFDVNRSKQMPIEDVQALATAVQLSGLKLTKEFFIANGLDPSFIDDAPEPVLPTSGGKGKDDDQEKDKDFKVAKPNGSKKKYW